MGGSTGGSLPFSVVMVRRVHRDGDLGADLASTTTYAIETPSVHKVGLLLRPFLPTTAAEVLGRFGGVEEGPLGPGTKIELGAPLFPKRSG
jgi:hypothetical protein